MLRKGILVACLLTGIICCGCSQSSTNSSATSNSDSTTLETEADATTTGSASSDEKVTRDLFAMDTYITLTAYGTNAEAGLDAAEDCINDLDDRLSTGDENSEISKLNANGSGTLSEDPSAILQRALEIYQDTDGAFNPLMYPIMQAWGFPTHEYRIPEDSELKELLKLTNPEDMQFTEETGEVSFSVSGMELDLGGIAKGYTSAKIMDCFRENGVESGMVSLGGNVQAIGTKPDGSLWRVAIQNPEEAEDSSFLGVLEIQDRAVITSGGYERYFEEDGVRYHHIMDPETGKPADSDLTSVTIVTEDGTLGDGLSTALFVMGLEQATTYWQEHADQFETILYTEDGTLYITEGLQDSFSSDYSYKVIQKGAS